MNYLIKLMMTLKLLENSLQRENLIRFGKAYHGDFHYRIDCTTHFGCAVAMNCGAYNITNFLIVINILRNKAILFTFIYLIRIMFTVKRTSETANLPKQY